MLARFGVASVHGEGVAVALHRDIVVADRHVYGETSVFVGLYKFSIQTDHRTVNLHIAILHGIVCAFVIYDSRYGEAALVGERRAAIYIARGTDISCERTRRELVDAFLRTYYIVGAVALVMYAADDVVTRLVGHGIDAQL